jgi:hypothetical protein
MDKTEISNGFYMAYVGANTKSEPVRVQDGFWYSTGCADPHSLDSLTVVEQLQPDELDTRTDAQKEADYERYRKNYIRWHGREPGHRRWPD